MRTLYIPGDSRIHKASAGVKLGVLALASLGLFLLASPLLLAAVALVALAGHAGLGLKATALWRRLRPFALVIVVVSIFNAVLVSPVDGLVTLFRLLALSALASLVTATTTTGDFIAVITRAAAPLERIGVMRAADLGLSIGLVIRFVPEILSRYEAIREAHRARGIRPRPSSLLVPLIIGTLRSADEIAAAIDARDIRRHK